MHIETPTPTVGRIVRVRRAAIVAGAALACAAAISACGSSSSKSSGSRTNLDTHHVATAIQQSILTERHLKSTVTCPPVVPQEAGRTFVCIATTTTRSTKKPVTIKTLFKVTVRNSKGYVTYVGQ